MKIPPRRQKIRATVSLLFLLLFPALFYYLSPVIPVIGSLNGIVTGSLIIFGSLFIVSTILGRSFCAYVCPAGAMQDFLAKGRTSPFPRTYFNWIKYVVWTVWLAFLFVFFRRAGGIQSIDFAYATKSGLSITDTHSLIVYLIVIAVFFLLPLIFGRRTACHTICWIAPFMVLGSSIGKAFSRSSGHTTNAKKRSKSGFPMLHIKSRPGQCIECTQCDEVCPMSLNVSHLQKKGAITSSDCILCGNCVDTCPESVLSFSWRP